MTIRTPDIEKRVTEGLAAGTPLAVLCRQEGMPCDDTVRNWAAADEAFSRAIARAREAGFDAIADRVRLTARGKGADSGGDSSGEVQRDRLIIETDLKLLAKWDPKRYGDRQIIAGDADAPLVTRKVVDVSHLSIDELRLLARVRLPDDATEA